MTDQDLDTPSSAENDKKVSDFAKKLIVRSNQLGRAKNQLADVSPERYHVTGSEANDPTHAELARATETTQEAPQMHSPKSDLAGQLRRAIGGSGLTRNQVAKQAGLSYSVIHGFMAGTKDLTLNTASRIAAIVGLRFVKNSSVPATSPRSQRNRRSLKQTKHI